MDNSNLCLLRKGGFILGPYTYKKTKTLLLQRELKVIDEVVFPGGHWSFLRDCPVFANVVETLRKQDLISDDENTETVNRYSTSISYTSSMAQINSSELLEGKDKRHISAVEIISSENESSEGHYGSAQYAKQKSKKGLWPIWLALGVTVLVLSYILINSRSESNEKNIVSQDINYQERAMSYYAGGLYKKSLKFFEEARGVEALNSESLIPYAALLLDDKQTVASSRVFNKAMDTVENSKHKALVGMGLLSLMDGEVRFADKNFEEALKIDEGYIPALFNLGVTRFYKDKFREASEYFKNSHKSDSKDKSSLMMYIISLIKDYELAQESVYLDLALSQINFNKESSQYKQESFLLESYIYMLKGDGDKLSLSVDSLLDEDPYLSKNYKKNLLLHRAPLEWVFLNKDFCRKIISSKKIESSSKLQMLDIFCDVKSGQLSSAGEKVRSMERQGAQSPLFGALAAYVQKESNSKDEALITIGNAIDNNRLNQYKLPSILQAQFCEDIKDYECSLKFWTKVSSIDPGSVSAKVGRIRAQVELKRVPLSEKNIEGLLEMYPNYLPLYKMAEKANLIQ